MAEKLIELLWRVANAKDKAADGGMALLHPDYKSFVEEAKQIVVIEAPEPVTFDDLILALILTFEQMGGSEVEPGLVKAEETLKRITNTVQVLKDVIEIKAQLPKTL